MEKYNEKPEEYFSDRKRIDDFINRTKKLTPRQKQITKFIAEGYANMTIARCLSITEATVKNLIWQIFITLAVANRQELIIKWNRIHRSKFDSSFPDGDENSLP